MRAYAIRSIGLLLDGVNHRCRRLVLDQNFLLLPSFGKNYNISLGFEWLSGTKCLELAPKGQYEMHHNLFQIIWRCLHVIRKRRMLWKSVRLGFRRQFVWQAIKFIHQNMMQGAENLKIHFRGEWYPTYFFSKLGIKPCIHLVKISIFSLNHVFVRLTKIMNNLLEHLKILNFQSHFLVLKIGRIFPVFFCDEYWD